MRAISDFLPRVLPYVPGCPDPLAEQAIRDAAIEFCEKSQVIRVQLDPEPVIAGQADYTLFPPAQHEVARVMSVALDQRSLLEAFLDEARFDPASENATPLRFYTIRDGESLLLRLSPTPDAAGNLYVTVALRPTRTASHLRGELFDRWHDAITQGALSRIRSVPSQAFSDFRLSQLAALSAARATNRARVEGNYGRIRGSMTVRYTPLA